MNLRSVSVEFHNWLKLLLSRCDCAPPCYLYSHEEFHWVEADATRLPTGRFNLSKSHYLPRYDITWIGFLSSSAPTPIQYYAIQLFEFVWDECCIEHLVRSRLPPRPLRYMLTSVLPLGATDIRPALHRAWHRCVAGNKAISLVCRNHCIQMPICCKRLFYFRCHLLSHIL